MADKKAPPEEPYVVKPDLKELFFTLFGKEEIAEVGEDKDEEEEEMDPEDLVRTSYVGEYKCSGRLYGEIRRFRVSTASEKIYLVVKYVTTNEEVRQTNNVTQRFENESYFFSKFANELITYGGVSIPKYFYHDSTPLLEKLIIEDFQGYDKATMKNGLDKVHIKLVIDTLASLQSACLSWKSRYGLSNLDNESDNFIRLNFAKENVDIYEENEEEDEEEEVEKNEPILVESTNLISVCLKTLLDVISRRMNQTCIDRMTRLITKFNDDQSVIDLSMAMPWTVLNHGNLCYDNILFTYKDGAPESVAFIGFDEARVGTVIQDLIYFLVTSIETHSLNDLRPFIARHKAAIKPKVTTYDIQAQLYGKYGFIDGLVTLYTSLYVPDVNETQLNKVLTIRNLVNVPGETEKELKIVKLIRSLIECHLI